MPQWLIIASMVMQFLQFIQQAVMWIEQAAAGQPGVLKKEQIMAFITAALQGTATWTKLDQASIGVLLGMVSNLIDMYVSIFNIAGVFKKSNPVTSPLPPG